MPAPKSSKMKWTPAADQQLLLTILQTHNLSVDCFRVADSWELKGDAKPTARAIKERLAKIKDLAKNPLANADAPRSGPKKRRPVSGKGKGASTPKPPRKRKRNSPSLSPEPETSESSASDFYIEPLEERPKGVGRKQALVDVKKETATDEDDMAGPETENSGHSGDEI